MKLTDFLQDVGRPIAYYPGLRRITGGVTATILLCQFIYWRGKENDPDGWLYKTSEDIEQETGLSYDEQKTARGKLKECGLIEEHYARLDHQMRFRVNIDAINEKWGNTQPPTPEHGDVDLGNEETPLSLNSNTENTTENTSTDFSFPEPTPTKKQGDLVDGWLALSQSPGIKRQARIDAILSVLAERLHVRTTGKRWEEFAKLVDDRQQKFEEKLDVFLDWLTNQKGFNPQFWPPDRMGQFWPQAFIAPEKEDRPEYRKFQFEDDE